MLTEFIHKNLLKAKYELLSDGTFFAEIPGIRGVWANEKDLEKSREVLAEVLEEWLLLKVRQGEKITGFKFGSSKIKSSSRRYFSGIGIENFATSWYFKKRLG